jgi:guanylate kinase
MHLDKFEGNYKYYRNIVYIFFKKNKEILKTFVHHEDDENEQHYENRLNNYIENINKDGDYDRNFKISAAAIALKKNNHLSKKYIWI